MILLLSVSHILSGLLAHLPCMYELASPPGSTPQCFESLKNMGRNVGYCSLLAVSQEQSISWERSLTPAHLLEYKIDRTCTVLMLGCCEIKLALFPVLHPAFVAWEGPGTRLKLSYSRVSVWERTMGVKALFGILTLNYVFNPQEDVYVSTAAGSLG